MFREMRRFKQQLPESESIAILEKHTSGVLAVLGDDGYPYTVPLSYVYDHGKLYFHCGKNGHKIDAIKSNNKASFCVIDCDEIIEKEFTTYYRSVVAFGKVSIMEESPEMDEAIKKLAKKYSPNEASEKEISESKGRLCMIAFSIEHLTGKEAKELMIRRGQKE